jgi:hypothetical protein
VHQKIKENLKTANVSSAELPALSVGGALLFRRL